MSQTKTVVSEQVTNVRHLVGNNKKAAWLGVVGVAIASWAGWINVGLPSWWPLAVAAVGAAYLIGRESAKRIDELLPTEQGILVLSFEADDLGGGRIYELSQDAYDNMQLEGGELFEWPGTSRRVVEVRDYDPVENVATGNWRESKPGSALAEPPTVDDVLATIRELRQDLEPDVAEARELRRRIRGIVRALDRQRAESQERALDEQLAPAVGSDRTISDVIQEELPEDLHPENLSDEKATPTELIDDEPDPLTEATDQEAAATDGGQDE